MTKVKNYTNPKPGSLFGATLYFSHNQHTNVGHQLRSTSNINYPRRRLLAEDLNLAAFTNTNEKKISLVTSLWAKDRHPDSIIPHRKEIEAALLANIYNPHIDQVVLFLDGVMTAADEEGHGPSTCHHFHQDMDELNRQFREASEILPIASNGADPMSKVICVDLFSGQPNYHQMFFQALCPGYPSYNLEPGRQQS